MRKFAWRGFRIVTRPSGAIIETGAAPDTVPSKWGEEVLMDARLRRRLEMAVRVRDFLRAHRTDGVAEGAALARLEELVQRAEDLAGQQRAGIVAARAATEMRGEVRRALRSKLLLYLSAVGRVAANENAELGAQFRLPRVGPNQPFVTMVRGMLEQATAHKELLVKRGMSETLITDITAGIEEFEQSLEATRAGRRDHVGASADLRSVMAEVSEQVKVLNGVVRYRFGDNAELMGAWASAHSVVGPFRSNGKPQDGGGETPGVVKPAA